MTLDQAFDAGLLIDEAGRPIVSRKQLADAKWITVHPNGAGSKGTPVQISENGTVLAGMGGKFNGKKLGALKGGKSMSLEQFLASHGVITNPPADPTLHQNRHKSEKRHQEALARLSKAQNEWSAKKTELTALYKSKLKSGEITAPDEVERLKHKAEAIPESESGQAAARLAAKIEARRLARSGKSAASVEQSIARQSAAQNKTPANTSGVKLNKNQNSIVNKINHLIGVDITKAIEPRFTKGNRIQIHKSELPNNALNQIERISNQYGGFTVQEGGAGQISLAYVKQ